MVKYSKIRIKHQIMDNQEPFTAKEKVQFTVKERAMIRNIQILNDIPKSRAVKAMVRYKSSSEENLKSAMRNTRRKIRALYPKQKVFKGGRIKTPQEQHKKMPSKREHETFKENRKKINTYLKDRKNRNSVNYERVKAGSKKYIDASEYELSHGVNSKASGRYRVKHGLSEKYTGRVIK